MFIKTKLLSVILAILFWRTDQDLILVVKFFSVNVSLFDNAACLDLKFKFKHFSKNFACPKKCYPPASEVSRELSNVCSWTSKIGGGSYKSAPIAARF